MAQLSRMTGKLRGGMYGGRSRRLRGEPVRAEPADADRKAFDALIEEYKILKSEVSETSGANVRAISYIQVYGFFIILLSGAYFSGLRLFVSTDQRNELPKSLWFVIISCASLFLFLLYSHITHTSFRFRVLRERMAQIETLINTLVGKDIYSYELHIASRFFARVAISNSLLAPNAWVRAFVSILFALAVTILLILINHIFDRTSSDYLLFASGTIIFISFALVIDDIRANKLLDISTLARSIESSPHPMRAIRPYVGNYVAFMLIFYILSAGAFDSPSQSSVASNINVLFGWMESVDEATVLTIVFIYDAMCGLVLPTPSELPLRFVDHVGLAPIILFASLGKAVGSIILFLLSRWWLLKNLSTVTSQAKEWSRRVTVAGWSFSWAYVLSQSIPFAPMRVATIAYAVVAPHNIRSIIIVLFGSAFGTVCRMILIWGVIGLSIQ